MERIIKSHDLLQLAVNNNILSPEIYDRVHVLKDLSRSVVSLNKNERKALETYVMNELVGGSLSNLLKLSGVSTERPEDVFYINMLRRMANASEQINSIDQQISLGQLSKDKGEETKRTIQENFDKESESKMKRKVTHLPKELMAPLTQDTRVLEVLTKLYLGAKSSTHNYQNISYVPSYEIIADQLPQILNVDERRELMGWGFDYDKITIVIRNLEGFIKDSVVEVVSDTITKILLEYVNTAETPYLYRGLRFKTEQERAEHLTRLKRFGAKKEEYLAILESQIVGKKFIDVVRASGIPVSAFKSIGEMFANAGDPFGIGYLPYGAVVTIAFPKDAYPVRYRGGDALEYIDAQSKIEYEPLIYRYQGEFRIPDAIHSEAIVNIELVDPK